MTDGLEIPSSPESEPFWDATARGVLVLQWCHRCAVPIHFPRVVCPHCLGDDLHWREASGRGVVHAFTVVHGRPPRRLAGRDPYVAALVELAEGPRLMTNIVGCPTAAVHVGQPVTVCWEDVSDPRGRRLPVFRPDAADPGGSGAGRSGAGGSGG